MKALVLLAAALVLGAAMTWLNNAGRDLGDVRRDVCSLIATCC